MRPEPVNNYEKSILNNIAEHNWHTTSVQASDEFVCYSYTVGLFEQFSHPEIIITGLPADVAHAIFFDMVNTIKAGEIYSIGTESKLWNGAEAEFVEVDLPSSKKYALSAHWLYQDQPFPLYQHIWPSRDHALPSHPNATQAFIEAQPIL